MMLRLDGVNLINWVNRFKGIGGRRAMDCTQARLLLSGYLDGALPGWAGDRTGTKRRARLTQHLHGCADCRQVLEQYRELAVLMSSVNMPQPPDDLGMSIRLAVADARASWGLTAKLRRWKSRVELVLDNILEPLALPASAGVLVALLVFAMVYQVLGNGVALGAAVPDSPTNLLRPARLDVLAGFPMSTLEEMTRTGGQHPLLIEATVDAQGEATSYRVITGRMDASVRRELDQLLLFSRFRPEMSFGRPTSDGRVVLSFSQIRVRG